MTRIKITFWVLGIGLTALWIAADPILLHASPFSQTQLSLINYTGIIAMGMMSVAMILSVRSATVEPHIGGLDKSYRLHKWLGIAGLVMAIAHWMWINAPGWLAAAGWMAPAARGGAAGKGAQGPALLRTLQNPARSVGQWCFYATVVLVVLALLRWFPYRYFLKTHRLLAIVFLVLVFHSLVLMKTAYWAHAISYVIATLMAGGSVAAIIVLFRRVGRTHRAVGEIDAVTTRPDVGILQISICLKDRWSGHDAGQFAFVNFEDGEGPHPFTISSTWKDDGHLLFLIKGLGDYTKALPTTLKVGTLVTVEGPYGRFTFDGRHQRQIWVSAGIGITPFVSRMQQLAAHPDGKTIDLFHATAARDIEPVDQLRKLAESAHVTLRVWVAAEDGRMTGEDIRRVVPEWRSADIWFCGPAVFGKELRKDFSDHGFPANAFHQELFHLR
ncbi:MAG TPA: ferric reductase-like transmembrane domain-containing protein [Gemmatimonadaceae bacterium]